MTGSETRILLVDDNELNLFLLMDMLQELGCHYVILGHSERRAIFKETDEMVNKKTKVALAAGLHPIVCVGETLEQREAAERILPLAADRAGAVIVNRSFGGGRIFEKVGNQPLPDWAQEFGCESWAQFLLSLIGLTCRSIPAIVS